MTGAGRALPVAALLCNAFAWGVSWWPFRLLQEGGLHPLWSTAGIYLLITTALLLARPATVAAFARQPGLWALAGAAGATNACFNWGVTVGDVVRVVLLFYLMPLWSLGLGWWLLGERPTPGAVARVGLALAGALLVLLPEGGGWPWPRSGADLLGLVGGLGFALTNVLLRRLGEGPAAPKALAMFGGGLVVALALAGSLTTLGAVPAPQPGAAWSVAGALLVVGFVVSNLTLQYGAARLPAQVTAVVMLSEILFAAASAWAVGASAPTPRLLAGGALVLLAGLLAARSGRH